MAVEIPVYVNISGGIDAAVKQIPKEMPKLERAISKNVLNIPVYIRGGYKTVQDALLSTKITAKDLKQVLKDISYEFERQSKLEANKAGTSAKVRNLAKAYQLVEQRLTGVNNAANASALMLQNSIIKVKAKLVGLRNQLSGTAPGSDAFNKINYQIKIQEQRLLELNKQLAYYRASGTQAGKQVSASMREATASMSAQSGVLGRLTTYMSTYVSVFQLMRFVKNIRDVTGELEYQRVALGHLLQDEEYGAELFERIKQAAVESPFRITQLVTYTKQLAAYRIEQENLFDVTKRLADVSAGLGVDMNRLILAYGQVRAASVLRGQELRQFTEAGIPLVELLAEKFRDLGREGTTTADVFKLISERAVPFSMIADIFEDLTDKGGMFYDMQLEQAKTLKGRWEKLKDAYDIALQSIGESDSFQRANDAILGALTLLSKYLRFIPKAISAVTASFLAYLAVTKAVALWNGRNAVNEGKIAASMARRALLSGKITLAEWARTKQSIMLTAAEGRLAAATNGVSRAMARLNIALIKNPWAAAIAAIMGLVVAFTSFRKKADESADSMHDIEESIEEMSNANNAHRKIDGLITRYENLSKKTDKSAEDTAKLAKTITRLQEALPGATDAIDNQNISLAEQARLLREINDAELERQRKDKEEELARAETRLEALRNDMNEQQAEYNKLQSRYSAAKAAADKGAAAINKEFAGTQTRAVTQRELDRAEQDAEKSASAAYDRLQETGKEVDKLTAKITRLYNQLHPEEVRKARAEWQNMLIDASKYTSEGTEKMLFTPQDVEGWNTLGEAIKKLKPQFKEAKDAYEGLVSAVQQGGALVKPELIKNRDAAKDTFDTWQALDALLGGLLSTKPQGRDDRLSRLKSDISELTNAYKKFQELTKYKSDSDAMVDINKMFPQLKGLEPTFDNVVSELNRRLDKVKADLARSPKSKTLLDMQRALETEISNLQFDKLKKDLENKLKSLSDELKRSETARNFYQNIFDTTGNQELAASMTVSVYGGIGSDFKERLQRELMAALQDFDDGGDFNVWDRMRTALESGDFDTIFRYMDRFPEEWQKRLKEMAASSEKFNADLATNLLKALEKAKTYGEKQRDVAMQQAKRTSEINALDVSQSIKDDLLKQSAKKAAEESAKLQYEAFKETPMYIELFANLDAASETMLRNMRDNLSALKDQWKDLHPRELKELQSRIQELDSQLAKRNPFKAMVDSIKLYREMTGTLSRKDADKNAFLLTDYAEIQKQALDVAKADYQVAVDTYGVNSEEAALAKDRLDVQVEETDAANEQAEAAQETANSYRVVAQQILNAAEGLAEWQGYISDSLDGIGKIVHTFASDDVADTFDTISSGINSTLSGAVSVATSVGRIIGGDWSAIPQLISGIGDLIVGTFGTAQELRIKAIDKRIKSLQSTVETLEYSYDRLGVAIEEAFGSDYIFNFNQQMSVLAAQVEAYRKQADAEREKGKKADEDTAKGYEESAREIEDKISDARGKLAEFMTGMDVTSAASDFAKAWIEAYKEFGSTTDAMKEKFNDMIENMVVNSIAARLIQGILDPVFRQIDDASKDGELTAKEIGEISAQIPAIIGQINNAMTTMVGDLVSSGINLREQVGTFTGISRNIASASEESINGLAAGINTQNFYMSHIDANVAAILSALTGGAPTASASATGEVVDPYKDAMLSYASHIPTIEENLADLLIEVRKVIKPRSYTPDYAVHTVIH